MGGVTDLERPELGWIPPPFPSSLESLTPYKFLTMLRHAPAQIQQPLAPLSIRCQAPARPLHLLCTSGTHPGTRRLGRGGGGRISHPLCQVPCVPGRVFFSGLVCRALSSLSPHSTAGPIILAPTQSNLPPSPGGGDCRKSAAVLIFLFLGRFWSNFWK